MINLEQKLELWCERFKDSPKDALEGLGSLFESVARQQVIMIYKDRIENYGIEQAQKISQKEFLFDVSNVSSNCTNQFFDIMKVYIVSAWARLIKEDFNIN